MVEGLVPSQEECDMFLNTKNLKYRLLGCQDKSEWTVYPIVNAVTKAWIQGRDIPILLVVIYATLLDNPDEAWFLAVIFESMKHGATVDMKPRNIGGDGGSNVDE